MKDKKYFDELERVEDFFVLRHYGQGVSIEAIKNVKITSEREREYVCEPYEPEE